MTGPQARRVTVGSVLHAMQDGVAEIAQLCSRGNRIESAHCLSLRREGLKVVVDVGLLSMLRRPTRSKIAYFTDGLVSRLSAYWHWLYPATPRGSR